MKLLLGVRYHGQPVQNMGPLGDLKEPQLPQELE